jgi:hypothetical protein
VPLLLFFVNRSRIASGKKRLGFFTIALIHIPRNADMVSLFTKALAHVAIKFG